MRSALAFFARHLVETIVFCFCVGWRAPSILVRNEEKQLARASTREHAYITTQGQDRKELERYFFLSGKNLSCFLTKIHVFALKFTCFIALKIFNALEQPR